MAKKLTLGSLKNVGSDDTHTDGLLAADDAAAEAQHRGQPVRRREKAAAATEAGASAQENQAASPLDSIESAEDLAAALKATPLPPEAAEEGTAKASAPENEEDKEPKDEPSLDEVKDISDLSALLKLSKGELAPEDVKLGATAAASSPFKSAVKAKSPAPSTAEFDSMKGLLQGQNLMPPANVATRNKRMAARPADDATATPHAAAPAPEAAEDANAPTPESDRGQRGRGAAQVPMAAGTAGGALVDLAGRAIASPLLALSSAYRHLKSTGQQLGLDAKKSAAGPQATTPSVSPAVEPVAIYSAKFISDWKCDSIERSQRKVIDAANRLRATDDFAVWEDKLQSIVHERQTSVEQVVQTMTTDPELLPLKQGMDDVWQRHPSLVGEYQEACDAFANHIRNVTKDYPNSSDNIRKRVSAAMTAVVDETINLPGFGDDLGEYRRTMAERVREQLEIMMQLLQRLLNKVGLSNASSEPAP